MKHQIGPSAIKEIATALHESDKTFNTKGFIKEACAQIENFELKGRVAFIIEVMHRYLPSDFKEAAKILKRTPQSFNETQRFASWPLIDYLGEYGLSSPKLALSVLKKLTSLFTVEFAIRPFLDKHFELTYPILLEWTQDSCEHVRRLCSECLRPLLPWAKYIDYLHEHPEHGYKIAQLLVDDPSLYVRRSVANLLNDYSKSAPDMVIKQCLQWQKKRTPHRDWLIKHASRTLVKRAHPGVWKLLGCAETPAVNIQAFKLEEKKIQLGESLQFSFSLKSEKEQKIILDYAIHYYKANGTLRPKIFKLKTLILSAGQKCLYEKKHAFREMTTRRHYEGEHQIDLLINGQVVKSEVFFLSL